MKNIFQESDYHSGDGMLTAIWGPSMWHFLHTISFNYPVNPTKSDKDSYYKYIKSLHNVLPCKYCRDNYGKNLKSCKFSKKVLENRDTFSKFVYDLHEEVNSSLGKTSGLTYDEIRNRYEHFRARCLETDKKQFTTEKGCIDSLYGKKSKCVLQVVPKESKLKTFRMSPKCHIKRLNKNI